MSNLNRRKFLLSAGLFAGISPFLPTAKATPIQQHEDSDIGKSKWDLNSPALCVDLDKMERNIRYAQEKLKGTGVATRPHAKTHKSPALAKMQIEAGAIGICVAKLSEGEIMLKNGIQNVLMTGVNVTVPKIRKAMTLRKQYPGFIQAVDNPRNARDLQDAAKEVGIIADVVVDIDVIQRSGVAPGKPALELAQLVDKLPNLRFRGILAYDGYTQHVKGFKQRMERNLAGMEPAVTSYELIKKSGLNLEIFSGGGTGTYNMMNKIPGFTDVQIGSYLFMDHQYMIIGGETNDQIYEDFVPSLTVLTTIVNNNHANKLITDAGSKSLTLNQPPAIVVGEPDFKYNAGSDEYGTATFGTAAENYKVGDKLELVIPHCDPVVNLYDVMYGIRKDKVESIIPILCRGKSQ